MAQPPIDMEAAYSRLAGQVGQLFAQNVLQSVALEQANARIAELEEAAEAASSGAAKAKAP